jgi:hypothetical protein
MDDNAKFEQLIILYRNIQFQANSRLGTLRITDATQLNLSNLLLEDGDDFGLSIQSGSPLMGEAVEVYAGNPKIAIGIIATNLDDLLTAPKAKFRERPRYFVIDSKFSCLDEVVPESIVRYRQMLKLIELIKESSAYLDEESGEFIFIDDGKFPLPIRYSGEQLQHADITVISQLLEAFINDTHREQKLAILSKSVRTICGGANPNERFGVLLAHLVDLQKSFSEGYRLFVADFSYDKIINQLETAKLQEIGKIHKTFSDIQNQILGIPVATVVVATQMKKATDVGYEFWVNTAVLIGCWVFVILSLLILKNQQHTLRAIGEEIERKKTQMLTEYSSVADLITQSFPFLEQRLKVQRIAFYIVDIILVIGFIVAHVVYFMITIPSKEWLVNLVTSIISMAQ